MSTPVKVEFNINDYVFVRLTDTGRNELRRQRAELVAGLKPRAREMFTGDGVPEEDDGWSRWQLWDLMARLGHLNRMGFKGPFETTIKFEVKS